MKPIRSDNSSENNNSRMNATHLVGKNKVSLA